MYIFTVDVYYNDSKLQIKFDYFQESTEFSNYQLAKIMKQSKLSKKIVNVQNEMNKRNTVEIAASVSSNAENTVVESRRVVSDDTSHYILIKGLAKLKDDEKVVVGADMSAYSEKEEGNMVSSKSNGKTDSKEYLGTIPEEFIEDIDFEDDTDFDMGLTPMKIGHGSQKHTEVILADSSNSEEVYDVEPNKHTRVSTVSSSDTIAPIKPFHLPSANEVAPLILEDDPDHGDYEASERQTETSSAYFNSDVLNASPRRLNKLSADNTDHGTKRKTVEHTDRSSVGKRSRHQDVKRTTQQDEHKSGLGTNSMQAVFDTESQRTTEVCGNGETSSEEDNDFLEVTINPANIQPDELFPASIFEQPSLPLMERGVDGDTSQGDSLHVIDTDGYVEGAEKPNHAVVSQIQSPVEPVPSSSYTVQGKEQERYTEFDGMTKVIYCMHFQRII